MPRFSFHHSAHQIAIAVIVLSVLHQLLGGAVFLFAPGAVVDHLQIWRPFTGLVIASTPMEIIFGALIIYSIGGSLESVWGRRRFLTIALGIPLIAECLTLLAYVTLSGGSNLGYGGASMIISTIWIAYGLRAAFSGHLLNFWGSPLKGETFALIGLGFVVLAGVFSSFAAVLPDLFAAGLTYLYMYKRDVLNLSEIRRRGELAYYNWKLKRLKRKSGLHVVKGSREDENSSTRYH
jgi:membrane associated rhomboid family serine protease